MRHSEFRQIIKHWPNKPFYYPIIDFGTNTTDNDTKCLEWIVMTSLFHNNSPANKIHCYIVVMTCRNVLATSESENVKYMVILNLLLSFSIRLQKHCPKTFLQHRMYIYFCTFSKDWHTCHIFSSLLNRLILIVKFLLVSIVILLM